MSMLFIENSLRFEPRDIGEKDDLANSNVKPLPSKDYLTNMFKSTNLETSTMTTTKLMSNTPKIQSNLVKLSGNSPSTFNTSSTSNNHNTNLIVIDCDKLTDCVSEKEKHLLSVKNEYEKQFDNYKQLIRKFYTEKLNNLKLTFKNQILKQKIYFETEIFELSKDYLRDYEHLAMSKQHSGTNGKIKTNHSKNKDSKNKHLLKMINNDLKKLLDYMKESLISSSDTLIEAYETCECLQKLEHNQASINRQYTQMQQSTYNLIQNHNSNNSSSNATIKLNNTTTAENVTEQTSLLTDEQAQINKYKHDLDDLMNTLDDIELQHLQRKELLNTKCKFVAKLKSKFKFIENKYDSLSKQISNLKFESYVYRELWAEKQRATINTTEMAHIDVSASSLSPSTTSRSSSTSSLSEECEFNHDFPPISSSSSSSTSSSSSSSMMSNQEENLLIEDFDYDSDDSDHHHDTHHQTKSDYNRKLSLITDLINLNKAKYSSRDIWSVLAANSNDNKDIESIRPLSRHTSSLGLSECSCEGDRVCLENCDLKSDRDVSNWTLTRQIESMPSCEYRMPEGSVIKCGKVLRIDKPFKTTSCSQLEFLMAIKMHPELIESSGNKLGLKIRTQLMSPEGAVKAVHTQEIPHFYREVFKYANLIRFL